LRGSRVLNWNKRRAGPVQNSICISPLREDSCYGTRISRIPVAELAAVTLSSPDMLVQTRWRGHAGPDTTVCHLSGLADMGGTGPTRLRAGSERAPLQSEI
jgi:hypothetical protein